MNRLGLRDKVIRLIIGALIIAPWLASVCAGNLKLPLRPTGSRTAEFYQQFLLADFDGDRFPDEAELSATGQYKDIEIYIDGIREESITFDSGRPEAGRLVSGDIDHDNDQDLVWYSQSDSKTIYFCLNKGRGLFGPATRYQPSDQSRLDLNPLLNREGESELYGHPSGGITDCALRADDSPVMEVTSWWKITTPASLDLRMETTSVRSFHLKSFFERGPPSTLLNRRSHLTV